MILSADDKTCVFPPTCNDEQFQCKSGKVTCIPKTWYCDGMAECTDASDEENCPVCSSPNYKCPGKTVCLSLSKICDGYDDCPDQSDEACCRTQDFLCQTDNRKHCISRSHICDGKKDCANAADEDLERCSPPLMGKPFTETTGGHSPVDIIDNKTITNIVGNEAISDTNVRDPSVTIAHPPNTYSAVIIICVVVFGIIILMILIFRRGSLSVEREGIMIGFDPPPDLTLNHYPAYYSTGVNEVTIGKRVLSPVSGVTSSTFIPTAMPGAQFNHLGDQGVYVDRSNTGISSNSSSNGPRISLGLHNGNGHAMFHPETMNPPPSPVTDHYDSSTRSSSHVGGACGGTSSSSGGTKAIKTRLINNNRRSRYEGYGEELADLNDDEEDIEDAYYGCPPPSYCHTNSLVDDDLYDDNRYLQVNPPPTPLYSENNSPALSPSPSTERVFRPQHSFTINPPPPPSPEPED